MDLLENKNFSPLPAFEHWYVPAVQPLMSLTGLTVVAGIQLKSRFAKLAFSVLYYM